MAGDYWVRITQEDRELGAGFVLTTCYVLTALHCLNTIAADNDVVNILLAGGQSIPGRVHRRLPEADMALIDVPERGVAQLKVPGIDRAAPGGNWRSPYRPSTAYAQLSGIIDAFPVPYHCEGGDDVQAIQLECTQPLGDYSGYPEARLNGTGQTRASPYSAFSSSSIQTSRHPSGPPRCCGRSPSRNHSVCSIAFRSGPSSTLWPDGQVKPPLTRRSGRG